MDMTETPWGVPYPCCEHCELEDDGRCWAADIGHGCSCLKCPPPTTTIPVRGAEQHTTQEADK